MMIYALWTKLMGYFRSLRAVLRYGSVRWQLIYIVEEDSSKEQICTV